MTPLASPGRDARDYAPCPRRPRCPRDGQGVRPVSWTANEDHYMVEYRDEGAYRLARRPKRFQRGPSLPAQAAPESWQESDLPDPGRPKDSSARQ